MATDLQHSPAPAHDLGALLRAAVAVMDEAELATQLQRLMTLVLEHTGAQRGVLLIQHHADDSVGEAVAGLCVEVECVAGGPCRLLHAERLVDQPPAAAAAPRRIVSFVVHSRQSLSLPSLVQEPPFDADPAVVARRVSSFLCLPLRQSRDLIGVLYLENLPDPVGCAAQLGDVLSLLAAQAALAVQNSRLRGLRGTSGLGTIPEGHLDKGQVESGPYWLVTATSAWTDGDEFGVALTPEEQAGELAATMPTGAGEAERWTAARMRQARLHLREGRWVEANAQVDEALALAQQAGDRLAWRPVTLGFGPEMAVLPGGPRRCEVIAQQAGAFARLEDDDWQLALLAQKTTVGWLAGHYNEAIARCRQALALVPPKAAWWTGSL